MKAFILYSVAFLVLLSYGKLIGGSIASALETPIDKKIEVITAQ